MKTFLNIILIVFIIIMSLNCVYADTPINLGEKLSSVYTIDERKSVIGKTEYNITLNGKDIVKTINVNEYVPCEGDYISLREFVEALGGKIEWDPCFETNYLGYFEILGTKYEYRSFWPMGSEFDNELAFNIILSTDMQGENVVISMNGWTEALYAKFVDNTIYIPITSLRRLLPRMGYLFNIDKEERTFNIKAYDFEKEKELMLEKFPVEIFGKSMYGKEYVGVFQDSGEYYCDDFFDYQATATESYENRYYDYLDDSYRSMYALNNNAEEVLKNMLQAAYFTLIDDKIKVNYDEELEAYIVYNKDYFNVEKLDNTYKIIVIRKYDNMVLYSY